MASDFLHHLVAQGRTVVTILKSNQYAGLASFTDVGTFVPLCRDRHGQVTREVAPARFALPLSDSPGQTLPLSVALIRDLRRSVPVIGALAESKQAERWDADLVGVSGHWWKANWVALPTLAVPTDSALIPIVTTASSADAVELAQTYTHRWPAQENCIRDFLLSLGLDTNHGFAKAQVENSEVAKIRVVLERKLAKAQRVAQSARERMAKALERSQKEDQQAKARRAGLVQLNVAQQQLVQQVERPDPRLLARIRAKQQVAEAALATSQQRKQRAEETSRAAFEACEHACSQQRTLLRELADLKQKERVMY